MNDESTQIEFRWPWTMIPLEFADEWIEFIRAQIGPGHPLFGKEFFPSARREDGDVILVDNDDDGTHVVLSFDRTMTIRRKRMPFTEVIRSRAELAQRLEHDHKVAMERIEEKERANERVLLNGEMGSFYV